MKNFFIGKKCGLIFLFYIVNGYFSYLLVYEFVFKRGINFESFMICSSYNLEGVSFLGKVLLMFVEWLVGIFVWYFGVGFLKCRKINSVWGV